MFKDSLVKELIKKHERVKFKHKNKKDKKYELDLGEEAPCGGRSSFYDDVKVVETRSFSKEYDSEAELKRIRAFLDKPFTED